MKRKAVGWLLSLSLLLEPLFLSVSLSLYLVFLSTLFFSLCVVCISPSLSVFLHPLSFLSGSPLFNSAECWMGYLDRNVQVLFPVRLSASHGGFSCRIPLPAHSWKLHVALSVFGLTERFGKAEPFMEESGKIVKSPNV